MFLLIVGGWGENPPDVWGREAGSFLSATTNMCQDSCPGKECYVPEGNMPWNKHIKNFHSTNSWIKLKVKRHQNLLQILHTQAGIAMTLNKHKTKCTNIHNLSFIPQIISILICIYLWSLMWLFETILYSYILICIYSLNVLWLNTYNFIVILYSDTFDQIKLVKTCQIFIYTPSPWERLELCCSQKRSKYN